MFSQVPLLIRAAADPSSDIIFVASVKSNGQMSFAVWDGSTWNDYRNIPNSTPSTVGQVIDVAWEPSGGRTVTVWAEIGGSTVNYFSWQTGTDLSVPSVQAGPDLNQVLLG